MTEKVSLRALEKDKKRNTNRIMTKSNQIFKWRVNFAIVKNWFIRKPIFFSCVLLRSMVCVRTCHRYCVAHRTDYFHILFSVSFAIRSDIIMHNKCTCCTLLSVYVRVLAHDIRTLKSLLSHNFVRFWFALSLLSLRRLICYCFAQDFTM